VLGPGGAIPKATAQVCSPKWTPSSISASSCRPDRVSAHHLLQHVPGGRDEPPRDRQLGGAGGGLLDSGADGLQAEPVTAGGQLPSISPRAISSRISVAENTS
jgi:hypothetical protein